MTSCSTCGQACSRCGDAFPDLPRVAVISSQSIGRPSVHDLLSTAEMATILHCAPSHVSRLAHRAGIQPAKVIPRGDRGRPVHRWRHDQVEVLEQVQVLRRKPSA